jgi:hypothetical protein
MFWLFVLESIPRDALAGRSHERGQTPARIQTVKSNDRNRGFLIAPGMCVAATGTETDDGE